MSPYMARKLRGEFHGSPLFQFGVGDNGTPQLRNAVSAPRCNGVCRSSPMTISRESLRLGSFFVSSQPNMMSFTASLSNRFGAWQNRVGWLALGQHPLLFCNGISTMFVMNSCSRKEMPAYGASCSKHRDSLSGLHENDLVLAQYMLSRHMPS